jgi:hypothetical protein
MFKLPKRNLEQSAGKNGVTAHCIAFAPKLETITATRARRKELCPTLFGYKNFFIVISKSGVYHKM